MIEVLKGVISQDEGLREALAALAAHREINSGILEIKSDTQSGRIGLAWGRYITGALAETGEQGRMALRSLLAARQGTFTYFDTVGEPVMELRQSLGIDLNGVIQHIPEEISPNLTPMLFEQNERFQSLKSQVKAEDRKLQPAGRSSLERAAPDPLDIVDRIREVVAATEEPPLRKQSSTIPITDPEHQPELEPKPEREPELQPESQPEPAPESAPEQEEGQPDKTAEESQPRESNMEAPATAFDTPVPTIAHTVPIETANRTMPISNAALPPVGSFDMTPLSAGKLLPQTAFPPPAEPARQPKPAQAHHSAEGDAVGIAFLCISFFVVSCAGTIIFLPRLIALVSTVFHHTH